MHALCDTCAVALTNADDSVWEDHTPQERAAIDASVEALGLVVIQPNDFGGYYTCFICNQVGIGPGHITT